MQNTDESTSWPLVSAIMLAGRTTKADILSAIRCFRDQTYPYKELIIVNNAPTQFDAVSLNIQAERDIFMVDTPFHLSTGMARNYGIAAANGRILAQFDPDHWFAPNRLESQIATMAENGSQVSVLTSTLSYSFGSGRATYLQNDKQVVLNTIVFVRPHSIDYPNIDKQEELGFLEKLQKVGIQILSMSAPELACKLYLTDGERIKKPVNCGLSPEHFKLIKKIVKNY